MRAASHTILKTASLCSVCGKKATTINTLKLASCETHMEVPTDAPPCPNCDTKMILKTGKKNSFWSCPDYPNCFGTRNLFKPMEEPDML
ncbi:MAG: hypothetical protein FJY86_03705 [Candidatus Diapherotrites archaeon]|uniref:DNA topoisomerase type IA zn finger domain-containing protein n=1 Tax=Candidatus Iainarchaeum sp. TaxID=3101447 RepID=A0A8T4C799_9ARCH|nr:hypothetical protein [Candidatus Diapherotrites archaeon]